MEKRSTIQGDKIGKRRKGKEGMEKKKGGRKEKERGRKIKEEDEGKRLKRKARRKWRNKRKDRKKEANVAKELLDLGENIDNALDSTFTHLSNGMA